MPNKIANKSAEWARLPDLLLLSIFQHLYPRSLLRASQVCRQWYRVALDEFLWKDLFLLKHKPPPPCTRLAQGASSWLHEYKRLYYHTPVHESEVLREHRDQVLHVSFSHDGRYFATSSKDGFVKVWEFGYPTYVRYYEDMRSYHWRYTQYTQFNESDTLLLVSGVHFGTHSTSGEIAVFSMENDFALQCTVRNKPYDIFGTWYNDQHLLSGNLHWLGNFSSCSVLYLNKSSQDLENIYESVVMQLFKFHNINASSVRTIMVASCAQYDDFDNESDSLIKCKRIKMSPPEDSENDDVVMETPMDNSQEGVTCASCDQSRHNELCDSRLTEKSRDVTKMESNVFWSDGSCQSDSGGIDLFSESLEKCSSHEDSVEKPPSSNLVVEHFSSVSEAVSTDIDVATCEPAHCHPLPCRFGRGGECSNSIFCPPSVKATEENITDGLRDRQSHASSLLYNFGECDTAISTKAIAQPSKRKTDTAQRSEPNKYLIFTTGSRTFTPHQIGIKIIRHEEALGKMSRQAEYRRRHERRVKQALHQHQWHGHYDVADDAAHSEGSDVSAVDDDDDDLDIRMDEVDHLIEMDGHIIGMCLSPDQRYLYVNTRAWPKNCHISDPLEPPPIAEQIEIHVIDLCTMRDLGTMHSAHKAFTLNDECFFIFLDVCDRYVASGAEDLHGYLWDREYRVLLHKYQHTDVVNSVAFHPKDPETLVSVSDDNSVKIWRSRNRCHELGLCPKGGLFEGTGCETASNGAGDHVSAPTKSADAHDHASAPTNSADVRDHASAPTNSADVRDHASAPASNADGHV